MDIRLFDAHNHPSNYSGLAKSADGGVKACLCNGTGPEDWESVLALAASHKGIIPCFGLHPWSLNKAGDGWLELLEDFLTRAPSCVGEIGLDYSIDAEPGRQEEAFRAQLQLAKKLKRPISIHCVRAWGRLLAILKEEQPPAFMLHAYGGPAEMVSGLSRLGAYFSFSGEMMNPRREKMRRALLTAPPKRLLFESESPESDAKFQDLTPSEGLAGVIRAAALALGQSSESLGEQSWRNAKIFLGKYFPAKL
ncbi:MAG: TatD family hydrolase [Elusimicrobiota bacterium]